MTKFRRAQVAFTAGELDPRLKGRRDTGIFYLGAAHLRNSLVRPQGSTFIRPGLRYISTPDFGGTPCARMIPFVFNQLQRYLIWLGDSECDVYRWPDNALISSFSTPYTVNNISSVDWIQVGDTILLANETYPIQQIQRQLDGTFTISPYVFEFAPVGRLQPPFITLVASGTTGLVTMTCPDGPAFRPGYDSNPSALKVDLGGKWAFQGIQFAIQTVADDGLSATALVLGAFPNVGPSADWLEPAAQAYVGYHRALAWFQERLWIGGSVAMPVGLWASRTGAPYDFYSNSTEDDQAFRIDIGAGQPEPILYLQPAATGLEVYTTGNTGLVPGDPLQSITPATVRYVPQTAFGTRPVKPVRLHANTIFAQAGAGVLREMTYSDEVQNYKADPLAIRASHLVTDPRRITAAPSAWGGQIDYVLILNGDGAGAALTFEKSQEVAAWAEIVSEREILDWASVGDRVYVATSDGVTAYLEYLDPAAGFDSQMDVINDEPGTEFFGFLHLAGKVVHIHADGYWRGVTTVGAEGEIELLTPATSVAAGLQIDWLVQPMPVDSENQSLLGRMHRPFRAEVRFHTSAGLRVNGQVIHDRPFANAISTPPQATSDVKRVMLTGWSKGASSPIQITRDGPGPVEILALAIDYRLGVGLMVAAALFAGAGASAVATVAGTLTQLKANKDALKAQKSAMQLEAEHAKQRAEIEDRQLVKGINLADRQLVRRTAFEEGQAAVAAGEDKLAIQTELDTANLSAAQRAAEVRRSLMSTLGEQRATLAARGVSSSSFGEDNQGPGSFNYDARLAAADDLTTNEITRQMAEGGAAADLRGVDTSYAKMREGNALGRLQTQQSAKSQLTMIREGTKNELRWQQEAAEKGYSAAQQQTKYANAAALINGFAQLATASYDFTRAWKSIEPTSRQPVTQQKPLTQSYNNALRYSSRNAYGIS